MKREVRWRLARHWKLFSLSLQQFPCRRTCWILRFQSHMWSSARTPGLHSLCLSIQWRTYAAFTTRAFCNGPDCMRCTCYSVWKHRPCLYWSSIQYAEQGKKSDIRTWWIPRGDIKYLSELCSDVTALRAKRHIFRLAIIWWLIPDAIGSIRRSANREACRGWEACCSEASEWGREESLALHEGTWRLY